MTHLEEVLSKKTKEEMAKFLYEISLSCDNAPWHKWMNNKFCNKCESVTEVIEDDVVNIIESPMCAIEIGKCPFGVYELGTEELIKLWLEEEIENED